MNHDYSDKEIALFKALGMNMGIDLELLKIMYPSQVYKAAIETAFLENLQTPAAESLRRCVNASNGSTVFRLTPEWDALISL